MKTGRVGELGNVDGKMAMKLKRQSKKPPEISEEESEEAKLETDPRRIEDRGECEDRSGWWTGERRWEDGDEVEETVEETT